MRVRGDRVLPTGQDQDNPPCRATAASRTVYERGEGMIRIDMCGIAGRVLRQPGAIGADLVAMLTAQRHRGTDSTGFALYGEPLAAGFV